MMPLIAIMIMLMGGTVLSSRYNHTTDVPDYIQVLLGASKVPTEPLDNSDAEAVTETVVLDDDGDTDTALHTLVNMERDLYQAYNLTYKIADSTGRILNREEHGDGEGSMKGFVNITKNDSSSAALHYGVRIKENKPATSTKTAHHMIPKSAIHGLNSSAVGDHMAENKPSHDDDKLNTLLSNMADDSSLEKLQMLSTHMDKKNKQPLNHFDDYRTDPVIIRMKPNAEGHKGEFDFRSFNSLHADSESEEVEQPLYIFNTKPQHKIFESTRRLDSESLDSDSDFRDQSVPLHLVRPTKLSFKEVIQLISELGETPVVKGVDHQSRKDSGKLGG